MCWFVVRGQPSKGTAFFIDSPTQAGLKTAATHLGCIVLVCVGDQDPFADSEGSCVFPAHPSGPLHSHDPGLPSLVPRPWAAPLVYQQVAQLAGQLTSERKSAAGRLGELSSTPRWTAGLLASGACYPSGPGHGDAVELVLHFPTGSVAPKRRFSPFSASSTGGN